MTALWVLLAIVAALVLLSFVRLGGSVRYGEDGLRICLIVGGARLALYPSRGKKRKKKKHEKKTSAHKAEQTGKERGGGLAPVMKLLPLAAEAAGALKRLIRLDELTIHLTWAAEDPMRAALGFGRANAAMGLIWPLIDANFQVVKRDIGVELDYERQKPAIVIEAALTASVGQLIAFGVRFGIKFLRLTARSRKKGSGGNEEVQL